jgi:Ca2+-binding EF-hand superfamily protein
VLCAASNDSTSSQPATIHPVVELAYLQQRQRRDFARDVTPDTNAEETPPTNTNAEETLTIKTHFCVESEHPLHLRCSPSHDAEKIQFCVSNGDVLRSEEVLEVETQRFVKLRGPWGEGWLCVVRKDGTKVLREMDSALVVNANVLEPWERDELHHIFRAICAMTPAFRMENGVARKSIEYVLPAGWSQLQFDEFFADFRWHDDGGSFNGSEFINFAEFARLHQRIREQWRFEGTWAQFRDIDENHDGMLQLVELKQLVPPGSSESEVSAWLKRFDREQKGYISLADFIAINTAVLRDKLKLALGTAFVMCIYFTYNRVTKASKWEDPTAGTCSELEGS